MPMTAPATMSTPYTASVTRINEPLRLVSSECDPDSTRFSNIFSVLPVRCQKGQAKSHQGQEIKNDCNFKISSLEPTCRSEKKKESSKWPGTLKPPQP